MYVHYMYDILRTCNDSIVLVRVVSSVILGNIYTYYYTICLDEYVYMCMYMYVHMY